MDTIRLTHSGLNRRYLLFHPTTAGPCPPAVVFLHGTGSTASWAETETGWTATALRHGFVLAVPEAIPLDPTKSPKFLTNPPRWNDASTRPGDPLHTESDDVAFLSDVVADLKRRVGADPRRVYVSGFSNGAGMAFRFAAERADLLAAISPVAGHCWTTRRPSRPVPTLFVVGTADPLTPLRGGPVHSPWGVTLERPAIAETIERWADALGCDRTPWSAAENGLRVDAFPGPVEFRALFVDGLGHHWPGGLGQLSARIGGTASDRLGANEATWEFFSRHRLPPSTP